MKTDTEIRSDGVKALTDSLGEVEAERFVSLLLREPFDYTRWQKSLFPEKSIQEISKTAMEFRRKSNE
ncbi:MAG: hypothetical protein HOH33_15810 [Verrucomicrobia bacterium]|jgi:hypothetical protein|nr:hypothetical protein [Verrucomicrobiota bacterium]